MQQTKDKFLTVYSVAHRLDLSPETVYRLVRSGEIRAHKFGKSIRIREADFTEYIEKSTLSTEN